jgi:DNA-directed RNA polymerase specialized sigma24 family protein
MTTELHFTDVELFDQATTADGNAAARLAELDKNAQQIEDTEQALARLKREQMRIMHDLYYLDGVAASEIAARLEITPQWVRRLAHKWTQLTHATEKGAR